MFYELVSLELFPLGFRLNFIWLLYMSTSYTDTLVLIFNYKKKREYWLLYISITYELL